MADSPATLRLYASIFEKPWYDTNGGGPHPIPESSLAAARALRFTAAAIEKATLAEGWRRLGLPAMAAFDPDAYWKGAVTPA